MLKLEKQGKKEINISLRKPFHFFDALFLKAFFLALGLHVTAFLVFHIHQMIFTHEKTLDPTFVDLDISQKTGEMETTTQTHFEEMRNWHLALAPKPSYPKLPTIAMINSERRPTEYMPNVLLTENPFEQIEEFWDYFEPKAENVSQPLEIAVSGPLSNFVSESDMRVEQIAKLPTGNVQEDVGIYEVRVEGKTGRVFWFLTKQQPKNQQCRQAAETHLSTIGFHPNIEQPIIPGEIKISFRNL